MFGTTGSPEQLTKKVLNAFGSATKVGKKFLSFQGNNQKGAYLAVQTNKSTLFKETEL